MWKQQQKSFKQKDKLEMKICFNGMFPLEITKNNKTKQKSLDEPVDESYPIPTSNQPHDSIILVE